MGSAQCFEYGVGVGDGPFPPASAQTCVTSGSLSTEYLDMERTGHSPPSPAPSLQMWRLKKELGRPPCPDPQRGAVNPPSPGRDSVAEPALQLSLQGPGPGLLLPRPSASH